MMQHVRHRQHLTQRIERGPPIGLLPEVQLDQFAGHLPQVHDHTVVAGSVVVWGDARTPVLPRVAERVDLTTDDSGEADKPESLETDAAVTKKKVHRL